MLLQEFLVIPIALPALVAVMNESLPDQPVIPFFPGAIGRRGFAKAGQA